MKKNKKKTILKILIWFVPFIVIFTYKIWVPLLMIFFEWMFNLINFSNF